MDKTERDSGSVSWWLSGVSAGLPIKDPDDTQWSIKFWFGGCASSVKLLYAMVAPFTEPSDEWIIRKLREPVFFSVFIGGNWRSVCIFLRSISSGNSIGQASRDAGFSEAPPEIEGFVPLISPGLYAPGTSLQETRAMLSRQANRLVPSSPSEDFPVVVSSLYLLNKAIVLINDKGDVNPVIARKLLGELALKTGMDFTRGGLERLGNIEIFHCLGAYAHEDCQVNINATHDAVCVEILTGFRSDDGYLQIRCRQIARGHILSDEMQRVRIESEGGIATFGTPSTGPYSAVVEIWAQYQGRWYLAWSHSVSMCRKICVSFHISGTSVALQSEWLRRYATSRTLFDKASRVEKIERYELQDFTIGGTEEEPVVISYSSACNIRRSLFPPDSDAIWLDKMRGDVDKPRLELVEWFRDVCSGGTRVLVLDPYFDSWGLELVTRLERSGMKIDILTTEKDREGSPRSLVNLKKLVGQMALIMHRDFRLYLTPEDKFHDRYIVIEKSDGTRTGYHLSNSLQNATQNYPILITPIPEDVLTEVVDYADKLTSEATFVIEPRSIPEVNPLETAVAKPPGAISDAINSFRCAEGRVIGPRWAHLTEHLARTHVDESLFEIVCESINEVGAENLVNVLREIALEQDPRDIRSEGRNQNAVRWIQMPFPESLLNDDVERLGFQLLRGPWWLHYAVEFLAERFPEEFQAWFDHEGRLAGASDPCTYPRSQVIFALRHQMLESTTPEISELHPCEGDSRALAKLLLNSRIPAIRASVAISVLKPYTSIDDSILDDLEPLADSEQVRILEWVVRHLLWQVTEKKDIELTERALELVSDRLVSKLSSESDIKSIIESISMRASGAWHEYIDRIILNKGIKAEKCREESKVIWVELLTQRIKRIVLGEDEFFIIGNDAPLIEIAALYAAKLPFESVKIHMQEIGKLLKLRTRILHRAFPRGRDYSEWSTAKDLTRWVASFGRLILCEGPENEEVTKCANDFIQVESDVLGSITCSSATRYKSELDRYHCAVLKHIEHIESKRE